MIEAAERELLRRRARRTWDEAKRLQREAASARENLRAAEELRVRAAGLRFASAEKLRSVEELLDGCASAVASSLDQVRACQSLRVRSRNGGSSQPVARPPAAAELFWPTVTPTPVLLEALVDETIRQWDPADQEEAEAGGRAVGLVASINRARQLRLQRLASRCFGYVVAARDAGVALGLAIVTQPDLSIIDASLDGASGSDLATVLPFYAPRTKTLLLTDDHDLATKMQLVEIEVMSRRFSDRALLSWISNAAT